MIFLILAQTSDWTVTGSVGLTDRVLITGIGKDTSKDEVKSRIADQYQEHIGEVSPAAPTVFSTVSWNRPINNQDKMYMYIGVFGNSPELCVWSNSEQESTDLNSVADEIYKREISHNPHSLVVTSTDLNNQYW